MEKKILKIPEVDMDKVLTKGKGMNGPVIKLNGKLATPQEISQMKSDATFFKKSLLYQVLIETPKWEAREIIFNKAKDFQDVLNGKTMLHTLGIQENIIKLLE